MGGAGRAPVGDPSTRSWSIGAILTIEDKLEAAQRALDELTREIRDRPRITLTNAAPQEAPLNWVKLGRYIELSGDSMLRRLAASGKVAGSARVQDHRRPALDHLRAVRCGWKCGINLDRRLQMRRACGKNTMGELSACAPPPPYLRINLVHAILLSKRKQYPKELDKHHQPIPKHNPSDPSKR